jgi:hypothetical protein
VRLVDEYVKAGSGEPAALERRHQRFLVDHRPPRHVDQESAWTEGIEDARVHQPTRTHTPATATTSTSQPVASSRGLSA